MAVYVVSSLLLTQHPGDAGHQFPADPELGLCLAHMDTQKMKMTGVNGPRVAFELMMIGGDLDRRPFYQSARWRPPRWT